MSKKTLYQKYCDGDRLTNKEVLEGVEVFENAYLATWKLGAEFRITAQEFVRVDNAFTGFARARGILKEAA